MNPHHLRQAIERAQLDAREALILATPGRELGRALGLPLHVRTEKARTLVETKSQREQRESRGIARMALERGDLVSARLALARLYPSFVEQLRVSAKLNGWRWPEPQHHLVPSWRKARREAQSVGQFRRCA